MAGFSVGGIASGFDTSTMIQQLMQVERQPVRRIEQRQADLRAVDEAWNEVLTKVSTFRAALDAVRDASDWSSFVSTSSSNEDAVGVSATGAGDPGSLSFTVDSLASRHQVSMSGSFASDTALVGAGSVDLQDDAGNVVATITTDDTTTLSDLARMVDEAGVGVDAQVLKVADGDHRLLLQSTATGAAAEFAVDATNLASLGTSTVTNAATDAVLDVSGTQVTRSSNTITDLLDGVTIDLKAETTSEVTVTSSRDTGAAADAVEELVIAANDVLATLDTHTSYDAESGRAGVLQGESAARSLQMRIRNVLSSTAGAGEITHGSQVGISLTRTGEVQVDRATLDQALVTDYDAVGTFMVDGLGASLDAHLDTVEGSGGSIQRSRDALAGRIRSYDDQIESFQQRLALREETLRRQFTDMETALSNLQAQGDWLSGQLGAMGGA